MHSYTIPTQLDTLKHHSDLSNRLQLDSVPEPYIYPLLPTEVAAGSVCFLTPTSQIAQVSLRSEERNTTYLYKYIIM